MGISFLEEINEVGADLEFMCAWTTNRKARGFQVPTCRTHQVHHNPIIASKVVMQGASNGTCAWGLVRQLVFSAQLMLLVVLPSIAACRITRTEACS
jgi:hypothetical protein